MADFGSFFTNGNVDILTNLANSLVPVEKLVTAAAYLMGIGFAIKAVFTLKSHGEQRSSLSGTGNMKEAVIYMLVAGMLLYFPSGFDALLMTTFGSSDVLAYDQNPYLGNIIGADSAVGNSITLIIQVIGLFAYVKGWVMLARGASQGQSAGGMGKALMHIFGGVLAMNIVGTMQVITNTLYGTG
ncbi:MAG: type IV secretion protein IcmC [Legionellaceae bacterium]|nr:type IV secretion protein IcmC [Legionellaceae bacterium]